MCPLPPAGHSSEEAIIETIFFSSFILWSCSQGGHQTGCGDTRTCKDVFCLLCTPITIWNKKEQTENIMLREYQGGGAACHLYRQKIPLIFVLLFSKCAVSLQKAVCYNRKVWLTLIFKARARGEDIVMSLCLFKLRIHLAVRFCYLWCKSLYLWGAAISERHD